MTTIKNRTRKLGGLLCLLAAATLFTCEKVPDYCGKGEWYDPGVQFCFASKAYNLCGGNTYNPLTEGCIQGVEVGTRCSDETVVKLGTPCGGYTLTASATPEIGGNVARTPPDKTNFAAGERVVLSASPNEGFAFIGWAGADTSKAATLTIIMNDNKPVVAMFKSVKPGTLTTTAFPENGGVITRNPDAETYATGETVTITAAAARGYRFGGWSGDMTSSNASVTVTMDESKTLVAMFTPIVYTMTVNANPTDGGTVFVNGTALAGTTSQNSGADIVLEARAAGGYVFTGWSGAGAAAFGDADSPNTTVTLEGDAAITANFKWQGGGGTVTPPPVTPPVVTPPNVVYGSVTDIRDGQTYRTVKIGSQTWMAENLNYRTSSGSRCYDDDNSNCNTYGRLYDWNTAMAACPTGWHLSTGLEWDILMAAVGGTATAGKKLKATSGWNDNGNGTDDFGFSALPGGYRLSDGYFDTAGNRGYWWTAAEERRGDAYGRYMDYYGDYVGVNYNDKSYAFSVRCLED